MGIGRDGGTDIERSSKVHQKWSMEDRLFQFHWGRMTLIKKPWSQYKCNTLMESGAQEQTVNPTSCMPIVQVTVMPLWL